MVLKLFGKHRWILVLIDIVLLYFSAKLFLGHIGGLPLSMSFILIAAVTSWLIIYSKQKICFDLYSYAFKVYIGMLIFIFIFLHGIYFHKETENLVMFLTLWLILAMLARYFLRKFTKSEINFLFLSPPQAHFFRQSNLSINTFSPNMTPKDLLNYDGVIIDRVDNLSEAKRKLISHSELIGVPVISLNRIEEELFGRVSSTVLNQAWFQGGFNIKRTYLFFKRLIDLVFVLVLSPIVLSLCLISTILILISMGRPIIFTQERAGRDCKPFKIYKFLKRS